MPSKFSLDTISIPLALGERPATWGLNLNAFPQAHRDFEAAYRKWITDATPHLEGTGAYLYPFEHTHVTAASPAPFTHGPLASWTEAERAELAGLWLIALRETCVSGNAAGVAWPSEPFPLIFEKLELKANCGIFMVGDPTGGVAKIRAAVAAAAKHRVFATQRGAELLTRAGFKTPNIVHSSIMRFVTQSSLSDDEIEERWRRAAACWPGPVTVMAEAMTYIIEFVPYQHMDPNQGLLAKFRYE